MKLIYTLETKFFFFFSFLFFFSLPSFVSSLRSVYILPACSSLLPFCPLSFLSLSPDDAAGRLRSRSLRKFRVLIIPPCFLCPLARAPCFSRDVRETDHFRQKRERERERFLKRFPIRRIDGRIVCSQKRITRFKKKEERSDREKERKTAKNPREFL